MLFNENSIVPDVNALNLKKKRSRQNNNYNFSYYVES